MRIGGTDWTDFDRAMRYIYCMNKTRITPQVLDLANAIVSRMTEEITEGIWWKEFNALSDDERAGLFSAIADGFNDSTEE